MQTNTMASIENAEFWGLRGAIEAGTGFAGWHGGIADSYRNTSDYLQMVGGQFTSHPGKHPDERIGEQSDNYVPHMIEMTEAAATHPITEGIGDFELVTEQYWVLHDDYNDVLATTTAGARVGPVEPTNHLARDLDKAVGRWPHLRLYSGTPGRDTPERERQDHY